MENVKVISESSTIFLNGPIDDNVASEICVALLQLEAESCGGPITMMINSPGGSVSAGWMIVDTIQLIDRVETICTGVAASMAAVILMSGVHRSILPHARVMLHQPLGGTGLVQSSDFEIAAREMSRTRDELYAHICQCTGQPIEKVTTDCDRDFWLTAEEAVAYGIVDEIVGQENRGPIYPAGNI
jgi:ATP-dependent Clp protease protease subunit